MCILVAEVRVGPPDPRTLALGTCAAPRARMNNTLATLSSDDLTRTCGGAGDVRAPLGGDVNQQINTNWGGTQIINPPAPPPATTRFEYLRQNPAARFGPPPYTPRPVRR
jgi:hypothetical protein